MSVFDIVSKTLNIGGSIYGSFQKDKEMKAAERAAIENWRISDENAKIVRSQTAENERRLRVQQRKRIGDIRAGYGASGLQIAGSPLAVLQESVANAELDALTVRYEGELRARDQEQQGEAAIRQGKSINRARKSRFVSDIFSIGSDLYSLGGSVSDLKGGV